MDVIQTGNKQVDKFGVGLHGFSAGNPGAGQPATYLSNLWCDAVQQELINVIVSGGQVPNGLMLNQLLLALQNIFGDGVGRIDFFPKSTPPTGYLKANGALVSRTVYSRLFASIGTTFGVGNGTTTFALPDLRGEFLRGWDDGRGVDVGRVLGSLALDKFQAHGHALTYAFTGSNGGPFTTALSTFASTNIATNAAVSPIQLGGFSVPRLGDETAPRSVALLACIKF